MFLKKVRLFNYFDIILKKRYVQKAEYHHRVYDMTTHKFSVFITTNIDEETKNLLSNSSCAVTEWKEPTAVPKDVLIRELKGKDGLFCTLNDKIDNEVLESGDKLKVISTMSVGYDHLDLVEIKKRNIKIGYTPGILTNATAELTLALLLATSRRLFNANNAARTGNWKAWQPYWMCGPGITDSTVGIVGFGRIGQQVGRLIKPFSPKKLLFFSKSIKEIPAKMIGATQADLQTILKESDFIIVTLAYTPETKNLFDEAAFNKMKKTAVFVNTSRGTIVDQQALVNALKNKKIYAAGLDVMVPEPLPTNHELFNLENCVILPHIGSASIQARHEMAKVTANNILAVLNNKPMPSELIVDC